jgi:hypothetical protein
MKRKRKPIPERLGMITGARAENDKEMDVNGIGYKPRGRR